MDNLYDAGHKNYLIWSTCLTLLLSIFLFCTGAFADAPKIKTPNMTDENAIMTIMGEEENDYLCMLYVASTIRNRNTLQGAYGNRAIRKIGGNYYRVTKKGKRLLPESVHANATKAWKASITDNKGCYHWFSKQDLLQKNVQRIITKDKLVLVAQFGEGRYINYFYAKPNKKN